MGVIGWPNREPLAQGWGEGERSNEGVNVYLFPLTLPLSPKGERGRSTGDGVSGNKVAA